MGSKPESTPRVTVVIPTYNRARALDVCLRAWDAQVCEAAFEVVVVNDGSTDSTEDLLQSYRPTNYRLKSLAQPNSGPAAARNCGLRHAEGDLVLFTGDDVEPARDLLTGHLDEHSRLEDDSWAVLGRIDWAPDLPQTSTMQHVCGVGAQQFSFHYMKSGSEYDFRHFYTSNVSVSNALLASEPTGFSIDFPLAAFEDAEYAYRLQRHGLRIMYTSSAVAWHHHHYTVGSFFQRQVACGRMAAVLIRKWPAVGRLIGASRYRRTRRRARFDFGARRRRIRAIESGLSGYEDAAIAIASHFDTPASNDADSFLSDLFSYAYFKGMADALESPAVAARLSSSSFLDLVVSAVSRLRTELDSERMSSVDALAARVCNVSV